MQKVKLKAGWHVERTRSFMRLWINAVFCAHYSGTRNGRRLKPKIVESSGALYDAVLPSYCGLSAAPADVIAHGLCRALSTGVYITRNSIIASDDELKCPRAALVPLQKSLPPQTVL